MNWFYIALIAPALWALVNIIDDNLLRGVYEDPFFGTIISGLFALLPLLSLFFVKITIPPINALIAALLSGFLLVCAYFFYFKALWHELPSITAALWNLSPALIPFLAFILVFELCNIEKRN